MAAKHFNQYIEVVLTGFWPDSDQILMSYLTAARSFGLPDQVVFDAVWEASGLNSIKDWQSLNKLNSDRAVKPSAVCYDIQKAKALKLLALDFQP